MSSATVAQESSEVECTSKTEPSSFFGRLPDVWARDPRISDADLCTLGYRCTFADDKSPFGLYQDTLSKTPIFSSGYCENVRSRSFRHLKQLNVMERPHNSTLPRKPGGAFARPIDRLIYPSECTPANSRQVFRSWHDGTVSCKAMALLHFMNAGTGKGPRVYRREIEERFGWSKKTTLKTLRELRRRCDPAERKSLVEERRDLNAKNRIVGCYYVLNVDLLESKLPPALPEELAGTSGQMDFTPGSFPASREPASREGGDIRNIPSTEISSSLPLEETPITNRIGQDSSPPSPQEGEGGRHADFSKTESISFVWPERVILTDWKISVTGRTWKFAGTASPPLDLVEWNFWLDQFGGAPSHCRTPQAHRQASEIANELRAITDDMWVGVAMVGVAFAVAEAHCRGHVIHSLGFIAAPLLRRADAGDRDWAFDVPAIDVEGFGAAADLSRRIVDHIEERELIPIYRRSLLSTLRVDRLRRMLAEYGEDGVIAGINRAIERKARPDGNKVVSGWDWFNDDIASAKAEATPPPPVRSLPKYPVEIVAKADKWKLVAPALLGKGKWTLEQWLEARAREHGVEPVDVFDELIRLLVSVDETRYANKQAAIKAITAGSASTARTRITQWYAFAPAISRAFAAQRAA